MVKGAVLTREIRKKEKNRFSPSSTFPSFERPSRTYGLDPGDDSFVGFRALLSRAEKRQQGMIVTIRLGVADFPMIFKLHKMTQMRGRSQELVGKANRALANASRRARASLTTPLRRTGRRRQSLLLSHSDLSLLPTSHFTKHIMPTHKRSSSTSSTDEYIENVPPHKKPATPAGKQGAGKAAVKPKVSFAHRMKEVKKLHSNLKKSIRQSRGDWDEQVRRSLNLERAFADAHGCTTV